MMKRLAVLALGGLFASAQGAIVFSNNPIPGDSFTNAGSTNQGQAVGTSGWYYNNVRNNGVVGINITYPRNGNGSAYLEVKQGPGGASSKADIEFLAGGTSIGGNFVATAALGRLGDLASLSYEWYRDSASTAASHLHPVVRILVDADGDLGTIGDRGGLVFERIYNALPVVDNQWTPDSVGQTTKLWSFGAGMTFAFGGYDKTLAQWIAGFVEGGQSSTLSANSLVLGFSMGVGSGWGPFQGAVDTFAFSFANNGPSGSANFEVVPEPASALALALGLGALIRRRR